MLIIYKYRRISGVLIGCVIFLVCILAALIVYFPRILDNSKHIKEVDLSLEQWKPDYSYSDVSEVKAHGERVEDCEEHDYKTAEFTGKVEVLNRDEFNSFDEEGLKKLDGAIYLYSLIEEEKRILCDFTDTDTTFFDLINEYQDGDLVTVIGEIDTCSFKIELSQCRIKHADNK